MVTLNKHWWFGPICLVVSFCVGTTPIALLASDPKACPSEVVDTAHQPPIAPVTDRDLLLRAAMDLTDGKGVTEAAVKHLTDAELAVRKNASLITKLQRDIAEANSHLRSSLQEQRELATQRRVNEASLEIAHRLDEVRDDVHRAHKHLAQVSFCDPDISREEGVAMPPAALAAWVEKNREAMSECTYWNFSRALSYLNLVAAPLWTSVQSETLGLNPDARARMEGARNEIQKEIDVAKVNLRAAEAEGDNARIRGASFRIRFLEFQRAFMPLWVGSVAVAQQGLAKTVRVVTRQEDPNKVPGMATFKAKEFARTIWGGIYNVLASLNFKEMRSNAYVTGDFLYKLSLVVVWSVAMNFVWAWWDHGALPSWDISPWFLIPNSATMMLLQAEAGARTTEVRNEVLPAKSWKELLTRVPSMVAGKDGFLHGMWNRLTTYAAAFPAEFPILTGWIWGYHSWFVSAHKTIDPLSFEGLSFAAAETAKFIGTFGMYLVVKWSAWDKLVELGFIPEWRGFAREPYEAKRVELAKKFGVPVNTREVTDPKTGEKHQLEYVAWRGGFKEWARCFVPPVESGSKLSFTEFFKYLGSGGWIERLREYRERKAQMKDFDNQPEVVALESTLEAKAARRQRRVEFIYRNLSTGFDTLVAIVIGKID